MAHTNDTHILIDTDLGGDVDDVGALALLNVFHNLNEVDVMGMTHSTSLSEGPGCMEIINRYFNNDFPIGAYQGKDFLSGPAYNKFAGVVVNTFGSPIKKRSDLPEAVTFLRTTLAEAEDHSVVLVGIGQLNVLSELLDSKPDSLSDMTGRALILKKVKHCVLMAGMFNNGQRIRYNNTYYQYEYNVQMDIPSAKHFIENAPTPIIFVDFLVGYRVLTMGPLLRQDDESNPITVAYKAFCGRPRESWDLIAVYIAARGCDDLFDLSSKGTVTVSNRGETSFSPHPKGLHRYIRLKKTEKEVEHRLNRIITDYLKEKGDDS